MKLPDGWKMVTIGDIGEVASGGTPSTKDNTNFDGGIAWITPADLTGYKEMYIEKGRKNLSEKGLKNSSAKLLPKGTILFSSRAPIGYVAIASSEVSTNQGFKNIIPNDLVDEKYVYYYLKSAKQVVEQYASGTTFREISGSSFKKVPFILAPRNKQTEIVKKIEELLSEVDAGLMNIEKSFGATPPNIATMATNLKQSILSKAFRGELI